MFSMIRIASSPWRWSPPLRCSPRRVLAQKRREKSPFRDQHGWSVNTGTVDFTIDRWSTDAERTTLLSLIPEENKSPQKLVNALQT